MVAVVRLESLCELTNLNSSKQALDSCISEKQAQNEHAWLLRASAGSHLSKPGSAKPLMHLAKRVSMLVIALNYWMYVKIVTGLVVSSGRIAMLTWEELNLTWRHFTWEGGSLCRRRCSLEGVRHGYLGTE